MFNGVSLAGKTGGAGHGRHLVTAGLGLCYMDRVFFDISVHAEEVRSWGQNQDDSTHSIKDITWQHDEDDKNKDR